MESNRVDEDQVIKELERIGDTKFSDEQLQILKHRGGMSILACAGSGKTSSLINLIAKRIKTGEIKYPSKLMCTTYSKGGADELEERLNKLLPKIGIYEKVAVKTLHALYLQVLKRFGIHTELISNGDRARFIRESVKEAGLTLDQDELQTVDSLLSYQINNILNDAELVNSYVYTLENVSLDEYKIIREGYNRRKNEAGLSDFDDLQLKMYVLLVKKENKLIKEYIQSNWLDFFVDEAQDVSRIQFEILRKMVTKSDRLVFIGDDDQCIYEWRGADPSIILNIDAYYDVEKFKLSTNYRCKGNIVRPAAQGIKNNAKRYDKDMTPFEEGGSIRLVDTKGGDLFNQSKYAFAYILDLVNNKGVKPGDIAVLSRNNIHLSILNNMLFREGIFSEINADMRFTGSYMYIDIKNVILLSEDSCDPYLTKKILWKMCRFMGTRGANYVGDFQESTSMTLSESIGYILWRAGKLKTENPRYMRINSAVRARVEAFGRNMKSDTMTDLEILYQFLVQPERGQAIIGLISMYLEGTAFMYKSEDKRRAVEGMVSYTIGLLRTVGPDRIDSFFRASEQVEKGLMDTGGDKITMSTMHGAKGKEWPYVILFADDNVAFPSFDGITVMLNKGIEISDISNSLDENRRLHYVAMTRAKENLTIFTDSNNPSVYLLEAFGLFNPGKHKSNGIIISMAEGGGLADVLVERGKKYLFDKEYAYLLDVDISNVMVENEEEETDMPEEVVEFSLGMDEEEMGEYY